MCCIEDFSKNKGNLGAMKYKHGGLWGFVVILLRVMVLARLYYFVERKKNLTVKLKYTR